MKKYVSQKPCRFGDRHFEIGEEIPADLIAPARVPALLKYGTIVTVDVPDEPPATAPAEPVQTETPAAEEISEEAPIEEVHAEETSAEEQPPVEAPAEPAKQEKAAKGSGKKAQK